MKYLTQNIIHNEEKHRFLEIVYNHQLFYGEMDCEDECATAPTKTFIPLVNELLSCHGYRTINDFDDAQWDEIKLPEIKRYMIYLQRFGLAYGSEIRGLEEAQLNTNEFLNSFTKTARFFCNSDKYLILNDDGDYDRTGSISWASGDGLGDYTFDNGVLVIDHERIGIYWFFDED